MGCFPWPCSGYYKKAKRPRHKTQGKKHKCKRRAKDKKKVIPLQKHRAEHYKHLIELPEAQGQETERFETSLASILAMVNFGSSTPSPTVGSPSSNSPETSDYNPLGYQRARSPESVFPPSGPPPPEFPTPPVSWESSPGSGQRMARPETAGTGGHGGTVYTHPHSMSHAHFLMINHTKHRGPPATNSALIPSLAR